MHSVHVPPPLFSVFYIYKQQALPLSPVESSMIELQYTKPRKKKDRDSRHYPQYLPGGQHTCVETTAIIIRATMIVTRSRQAKGVYILLLLISIFHPLFDPRWTEVKKIKEIGKRRYETEFSV